MPVWGWIGPFTEWAGAGSAGAIQSIPLTDISKWTGFVHGRDLEEAHHPGGHSDEVLPAIHLTPSAANVLPLCCCTNLVVRTQNRYRFNASCAFVSITGKIWCYLGICLNFPSHCKAEGLCSAHTAFHVAHVELENPVCSITTRSSLPSPTYLSWRHSRGAPREGLVDTGARGSSLHLSPSTK